MSAVSSIGEYIPKKDNLCPGHGRRGMSEQNQRTFFVLKELDNSLEAFLIYYKSFYEAFNRRITAAKKPLYTRCLANLEEAKRLFEAGDGSYKQYYTWHLYENWDLVEYDCDHCGR